MRLPERAAVKVIDVHVAEQDELQRRELVGGDRRGCEPRDHEDRSAQVRIGQQITVAEADQHGGMADPDHA